MSTSQIPLSPFALWFKSLRAISLTATAIPGLAILIYGLRSEHWSLSLPLALSALLGAICLQLGTNLLNDVEDFKRGIDGPGKPGGSGVLNEGLVLPWALKQRAFFFFGLGIIFGIPSLIHSPIFLIPIALVAFLIAFGYSGYPFYMKYKALGEIGVLLACGPLLTLGISLSAFSQWNFLILIIGVLFGLLACGILDANNLEDMVIDKQQGATTLAHLITFHGAKWLLFSYYALFSLLLMACVFSHQLPWPCLFCLLPVTIMSLKSLQIALSSSWEKAPLENTRFLTAQVHLITGVVFCLALLWG